MQGSLVDARNEHVNAPCLAPMPPLVLALLQVEGNWVMLINFFSSLTRDQSDNFELR